MWLKKFSLVLWKNFLLRKRHWIITAFEIIIPSALFILAAVFRSKVVTTKNSEHYYYMEDLPNFVGSQLLYAPNNSFTDQLVQYVKNISYPVETLPFSSEEQLLEYYYATNRKFVYSIIFEDLNADSLPPQQLRYKIRISGTKFSTSATFPLMFSNGPGINGYYYESSNFLYLQKIVDETYINIIAGTGGVSNNYEVNVQQFPHPEYEDDIFITVFSIILPFFTVLSFIMICPSILKRVVEEKETGVKELMKMMGLKNWMLWLGWMINALIVNILSVTIITILLKVNFEEFAVLNYSDGFLVWLYILFYCIAGITFCFAISAFFYRPTLAMTVGIVLWLLSYSSFSSLTITDVEISLSLKLLTCVLPNMAISWGYRLMMELETKQVGLSWDNFFEPSSTGGDITVGHTWVMLIVDIFIYGTITWYVDNIMPGKYGVAKPWYFVFMPSYWVNRKSTDIENEKEVSIPSSKFETPPSNLKAGIKIKNLRKVFQSLGGTNKKVAVDGVTLDIYSGEITALLGHNGAGKTTTMSIITGLTSPTSGSVYIDGYDIQSNLEKVRESLGLCPQHNLLFTDLTVYEHLVFFAMLKGLSYSDAKKESTVLLDKLNLAAKKNEMCSVLSGGMKRKLSLGIALIGHTKVLMLDEPTSGMDPEARREIWDILLKMRGERTILITTHFMEEADVLGDRIAIMDHGQVQCYGTSIFLKKIYGAGYQLNLLKEENCNIPKITRTIQEIISDAKLKSEMGSFLSYMLPAEQTKLFSDLFDVLERDKRLLGISSIGVSITTLEEVFLRVGKEAENGHSITSDIKINEDFGNSNGNIEALTYKKNTGSQLLIQQCVALFKKRLIFFSRRWIPYALQAAITIVMTILTVALLEDSENTTEPALTLNLSLYGNTEALFSYNKDTFASSYENIIKATGSEVRKVDSVSEELLSIAYDKGLDEYFSKHIIANEFNFSEPTNTWSLNAMYSSVALHSAPISLNILTNTILQSINPDSQITVTNHPLEKKEEADSDVSGGNIGLMMQWMSVMPFGLLFLTGCFIRFPLLERVSNAKQLQLMCGVSPVLYWCTCFICDIIHYLIIAGIMILLVFVSDPLDIFTGSEELGVLFFILLMYGFGSIPFVYLFSYFRKTNAGSFALLVIVNMLIGMIMTVVVYFMLQSEDYESIAHGLQYVFEFIPHFALSFGLMRYSNLVYSNNKCKMREVNCVLNPMSECCRPIIRKPYLEIASDDNVDAIGLELLYLAIDSVLYFLIIILIEYGIFSKLNASLMAKAIGTKVEEQTLEDDVYLEKKRIENKVQGKNYETSPGQSNHDDDIMLVDNLVKKFKVNFAAVKGVSFGVAPGECFGLLGVNGAGKTTTFRMLTGDEIPSSGNAWISSYSLTTGKAKFLSQIGYCPQFDAINEALTGYEMLELFANLRGVSKYSTSFEVNKWISLLGLNEYKNRKCGTYSGGNKRKLSTAMALIGDPPIIFLDEPTSGVDPVARRNLWTVLTTIQKSGQSVVLTSHSMEECEALCNRLAIMVCGQFMCMGGIQYLKQKFGQGFTIMVKLRGTESPEEVNRVKCEIEESFKSGCVLKDEHQGLLHYHITDPNIMWKYLFNKMEYLKHSYTTVEDYTISETTLEQVFLSFARGQTFARELSTDL